MQRTMDRHYVVMVMGFVCVGLALLGNPAAAQEAASIIGQVKDDSGGVLPGVTVTVTSPVLQVRDSFNTNLRLRWEYLPGSESSWSTTKEATQRDVGSPNFETGAWC